MKDLASLFVRERNFHNFNIVKKAVGIKTYMKMRLSKFKASPSKLVIKMYAPALNSQTRVSGFSHTFLISSIYIDFDIRKVGSSRNIFKKMETPIHDKCQVTSTSQTTS